MTDQQPDARRATPQAAWRNVVAVALIVLGVLTLSVAISAVWLNRTVMEENRWVETVAPLAQDPEIQDYVATRASTAIFGTADVEGYVAKVLQPLPAPIRDFSAAIANAIQGFARDSATKFVRSPRFPAVWERMNRIAHRAFIASISPSHGGVVGNQDGRMTLDVSVLVAEVKAELTQQGLGFVNAVPTPAKAGQIVLLDSPVLGQLGVAIQIMNAAAFVLPLIAIALLAAGIGCATDRRKAVLWMGAGIVTATLLPLQAIYLGQYPFAQAALKLGKMPSPAAQAAYTIVFRNLVDANRLGAVVGLVFILGAMAVGPNAWASAMRGVFVHGVDTMGSGLDFGRVGVWVRDHLPGVRSAGVIVAVGVLLVVRVSSVGPIVWLVVGVLVWLVVVQVVARPRITPSAATDGHSPESGQPVETSRS